MHALKGASIGPMDCQKYSLVDGRGLVRECQSEFRGGLELSSRPRSHSHDLFCGVSEYTLVDKCVVLDVSIVITDPLPFSPYLYSL